jgi:hypothetical protein
VALLTRSDRGCVSHQLENIHRAVEKAAGCPAKHVETVMAVEVFRDKVMWQGSVEVFDLVGHPKAKRAYGWQEGEDFTSVLEIPPVDCPNAAVRTAIAAKARK